MLKTRKGMPLSGSSDAPEVQASDRLHDGACGPAPSRSPAALGGPLRPTPSAAARPDGLPARDEAGVNRSVGRRVRARRHGLGLTLKEVSRRTGLSVSLISQIELGRSAASVQSLYKVSLSLDVPMATFFEGL